MMLQNEINMIDKHGLLAIDLLKHLTIDNPGAARMVLQHSFLRVWLEQDRISSRAIDPMLIALKRIFPICFLTTDSKTRSIVKIVTYPNKTGKILELRKAPKMSDMRMRLGFSGYLKDE